MAQRPAGTGASRVGTPAQGRELRARGRRTLRRLLDAGVAVFAERGLHAARVDDIVKAAKTSHGTFYLYFANKEDLFRALAVDVAEHMVELASEFPAFTPDGDGRGALRDWLGRFADLYDQYGPVIRAWTEAEIVDSEFGRIGGELVVRFAACLAERIGAAAPDVDPEVAALAIVAMIERSSYYVLSRQLEVGREEMLDTLATVTRAAVYGPA
ncbi:MAG TPA: helix-turn-helix domain-containing protein [Acidimicrobiia bacterium]|nr:helix-turn-helix domain-containing protein [Acidimicrobiia bacterium]